MSLNETLRNKIADFVALPASEISLARDIIDQERQKNDSTKAPEPGAGSKADPAEKPEPGAGSA